MSGFKDHFSKLAADYHSFRPAYPSALFQYLASIAPTRTLAWDSGTGNGQAAVELAKHFDRVIATDASAEQLRQAEPHPSIEYRLASAEESALASGCVDLVTVAQALHWFDIERFFGEVRRVLKPGGILAVIGYSHHRVNDAVNVVIDRFERDFVAACWPMERAILEAGFRTVPFPFRELDPPAFQLAANWTHAEHLGYLRTWSAVKEFIDAHGFDPVERFAPDFCRAWGDPAERRPVTWRLHLRVGYVN